MVDKNPTEEQSKRVTEVWDFLDSHTRTPATVVLRELLKAYEEETGASYDPAYSEFF